jgi:hypothetical protein
MTEPVEATTSGPDMTLRPAELRPGDLIVQPEPDDSGWPEVESVGSTRNGETVINLVEGDPMSIPSGNEVAIRRRQQ